MSEDFPSKNKHHHDVFISYAQQDKPIADAVCAKLESRHIRCWIAPRDVPPGQAFPEAIIEGIDGSKVVVIIFSSYANKSPHVIRELTNAVNKGLIIIPFRIENVPPSKSMEYLISVPHWLDAVTPPLEKHIDVLVKTLDAILGTDRAVISSPVSVPPEVNAAPEPAPPPVAEPPPPPESPSPPQPEAQKPVLADIAVKEDLPRPPADTVPAVKSKTLLVAGIIVVVLIVAILVFQSGVLSLQQQGPNADLHNKTNTSHPGLTDEEYYRSSEARVNTVVLTVGPTQTLAKDTEVYLDVDKDSSNAVVTVQFNGGPGINLVMDNQVILTRSDGTVTEGKLNFNKRLSSVQLQGTRGTDRLQVILILHSGERKTIEDKLMPYRQYR
jgi:hypothetical protein